MSKVEISRSKKRRRKMIQAENADSALTSKPLQAAGNDNTDSEGIFEAIKSIQEQNIELQDRITSLNQEFSLFKNLVVPDQKLVRSENTGITREHLVSLLSAELKSSNSELLKQVENLGRPEYSALLSLLTSKKQEVDIERTISYQLGKAIIESTKSLENLLRLPAKLLDIKAENERRKQRQKLKYVNDDGSLLKKSILHKEGELGQDTQDVETVIPPLPPELLNKKFSKALTLLDPISELCWQDGFPGFAISRQKFEEQITSSSSDFAFFESAWKANKSQWVYAFNSPNLQHKNAQDLFRVISLLRAKRMPIIFWNKEDPMHYEMFKPIAKEADYVFTTDILKVEQYKKDLGHNRVWELPFAAPIRITNPVGRFELDTENICFAGTYYAKNHPERKEQMDKLLPVLLKFGGTIYNRASNLSSDNYLFPEIYQPILRDGVNFEEMTRLYKKFKIFLNVNTITNSPTMMSRRVYELLASGTPVISTPSKAITEQFPGIVLTVRNEKEAELAVEKLLTDSYFWNRQSVLGIREVLSKHTYESRWADIRAKMRGETHLQCPSDLSLKVVAIYHGYQDLGQFIQHIFDQNENVSELVILKSSEKELLLPESTAALSAKVAIENIGGFDLKQYINDKEEDYTLFTTDKVMLFKNCLTDMILSMKYNNAAAVSRRVYYDINEIKGIADLQLPEPDWFAYTKNVDLNCLLISNKLKLQIHIDLDKQQARTSIDSNIYLIDPFNVVKISSLPITKRIAKIHEQFKYKFETTIGI
ncbi:glycosyltransferase [Alkanindiges sp. WGS2144]|uniref:CgeB family protein n=1 Tax=Alkanindiges sp. WGS2144 TaxID=3366808 RepID=UPI00375291D3